MFIEGCFSDLYMEQAYKEANKNSTKQIEMNDVPV